MRFFLLLASLCLLVGAGRATGVPLDTAALRIERLPHAGLLLQKGWRYHPGDNPAWARPDFDDSQWDTLKPARPRRELPAALGAGISWLRLRFRLGDSLRQRAIVLQCGQLAACQLYVNGHLVLRQGTLAAQPAQARPSPALSVPVELPMQGTEQVLAVRVAAWQLPPLRDTGYLSLLRLSLLTVPQLWHQQGEATSGGGSIYYIIAGVFGVLTLIRLAFFRYTPAQRANLHFALYALCLAVGTVSFNYRGGRSLDIEAWLVLNVLPNTLLALSSLFAVRALHHLFNFRAGWPYGVLWVGFGMLLPYYGLNQFSGLGFAAFIGFMVLATATQVSLASRAALQHRRGAWMLSTGFAGALVALVGYGSLLALGTRVPAGLASLFFPLVFVLPALGVSLFLAREYTLDSYLLKVKLREVEHLSAQTLAQEQDKQALLAQQNETLEREVRQRTGELQRSLTELRQTQTQLIQKEKMASLGELTAGIAHEIQNPLNFVTNFSEVSTELVQELREAQTAGDAEEVTALADDLAQNLGKIHQHGQRAADIVKGMLEHSRLSTGERQPTDLNALADEYLRLAYHGLRAKDKTFNAQLTTDFAPELPPVEAVGQDVGRVLLNLFNNAFYAVQKRQQTGEPSYAPTVSVSTRHLKNAVEVRVSDNGMGMSPEVQQKIFQPFFTTKPTGEGTGLGLSLSYDIITQGHGGTITVESEQGRGTEFTVRLPA